MAITEADIVSKLKVLFPNGIIYEEQYLKHTGALSFEIYKQAKASQMTRVQWLSSNGFVWKNTGYVEPDLRYRDITKPTGELDAFTVANYVFSKYPLAGEYVPSAAEDQLLYQSAKQTVQKVLKGDTRITARENVVLVLETIELLKTWSSDVLSEETGTTFWSYVFQQYGFNAENSDTAGDRLYAHFRKAVKETLMHYKRFFAPQGTHRYYTSLLLHAMAPRQSIEALFSILFDFYVKNLDFQYVDEDISYKVFTKGMRARWDAKVKKNEDLHLRSDAVFSGLQTLFKERPGYMAVLCDSIVKRMDAMLRGESGDMLAPKEDYWDYLLVEWYQKKSNTERIRVQGEKRQKQTEYVATSAERIFVQYSLSKERVGLALPRIRLSKVGDRRPVIRIYQNEELIFEDDLSVTGDDLCLTTKSRFIALEDTSYNFSVDPILTAEIEYLGDMLYQSGKKLQRQYILFDAAGNDRTPKSGSAFLFASDEKEIEFAGDSGIYQCGHRGQLYSINLGEVASVAVAGVEIFADEATASHFRHHTSVCRVDRIQAIWQGKSADIFAEPFSLTIRLPEGEQALRYQISVDGQRLGAGQVQQKGNEMIITSSNDDGIIHVVRVVDVTSDIVRYEYCYMVIDDCCISWDRRIYRAGVDDVSIIFSYRESETTAILPMTYGTDCVRFVAPEFGDMQFEVEVPAVNCTFMGENAFAAPDLIWHKDIANGEVTRITVPKNYSVRLMIGLKEIPANHKGDQFELGNELRAMTLPHDEADLWISIKDDTGKAESFKITTIVFAPKFPCPPLDVEGDNLVWHIESNFIGDPDCRFKINCESSDGQSFSAFAGHEDGVLANLEAYGKGRYSYQVSTAKKSMFSVGTATTLLTGTFFVGDPNEFAFIDKEIVVRDALCWDFDADALRTVPMKEGCGIITDLVYQGYSSASGESVPTPCYQATMCFEDQFGRRRPFNRKASDDFELINPVSIWIINNHLLILHCATDDTVYIDTKFSTIVNRNPNKTMNKVERQQRLETPDYFEYEVREEVRDVRSY